MTQIVRFELDECQFDAFNEACDSPSPKRAVEKFLGLSPIVLDKMVPSTYQGCKILAGQRDIQIVNGGYVTTIRTWANQSDIELVHD